MDRQRGKQEVGRLRLFGIAVNAAHQGQRRSVPHPLAGTAMRNNDVARDHVNADKKLLK